MVSVCTPEPRKSLPNPRFELEARVGIGGCRPDFCAKIATREGPFKQYSCTIPDYSQQRIVSHCVSRWQGPETGLTDRSLTRTSARSGLAVWMMRLN